MCFLGHSLKNIKNIMVFHHSGGLQGAPLHENWDERGNGKHIHDIALACVLMLLLPLLLSLLFVASAITAVAACISDTWVSCPSPLLWLKSLLLTMKLVMAAVALVMMTSRAHSCAARSCDPSVTPWGSKDIARDTQ